MTAVARSHSPADAGGGARQFQPVALDDPVPSDSTIAVIEPRFCHDPPHQVETDVQRVLVSQPELHFKSLVVRRVANGVCLEGVLEVDDNAPDVTRLARQVAGVEFVLNRLIVRSRGNARRKRR